MHYRCVTLCFMTGVNYTNFMGCKNNLKSKAKTKNNRKTNARPPQISVVNHRIVHSLSSYLLRQPCRYRKR